MTLLFEVGRYSLQSVSWGGFGDGDGSYKCKQMEVTNVKRIFGSFLALSPVSSPRVIWDWACPPPSASPSLVSSAAVSPLELWPHTELTKELQTKGPSCATVSVLLSGGRSRRSAAAEPPLCEAEKYAAVTEKPASQSRREHLNLERVWVPLLCGSY